jgi:hypothetical protein
MTAAHAPDPFQEIGDGPLPPVDPKDLKLMWEFYRDVGKDGKGSAIAFGLLQAVCGQGANVMVVWQRMSMISTLIMIGPMLAPWQHGEELDDIVFRVASTFPINGMKCGVRYESLPFDLDGFLQVLRDGESA